MTYVPSAIIGGSIVLTGIIVGNMAIWKTMDAYDESISETHAMFSTGEEAYPSNKRVLAGRWYRSTHPDGPLTKMLRIGQTLTVAGFLLTLALLAV